MKNGKCPRCNSQNVFHQTNGIYVPKTLGIFVNTSGGGHSGSNSEDYVCTDCGYYERYISDGETLKAVAKAWKKAA